MASDVEQFIIFAASKNYRLRTLRDIGEELPVHELEGLIKAFDGLHSAAARAGGASPIPPVARPGPLYAGAGKFAPEILEQYAKGVGKAVARELGLPVKETAAKVAPRVLGALQMIVRAKDGQFEEHLEEIASGEALGCIHCGDVSTGMAAARAHILVCPKHPLARLRKAAVAVLQGEHDCETTEQILEHLRELDAAVKACEPPAPKPIDMRSII